MSEQYVKYPRQGGGQNLPPTSLAELRQVAAVRSLNCQVIIFGLALPGFVFPFVLLALSRQSTNDAQFNLGIAMCWLVGYLCSLPSIVKLSRSNVSLASTESHRPFPLSSLIVFLPILSLCVSLWIEDVTRKYFKARNISPGFLRPSDAELERYAQSHGPGSPK